MIAYDDKEVVSRDESKFRVVVYQVSNTEKENEVRSFYTDRTLSSYAEAIRFCRDIQIESVELDADQDYESYINRLEVLHCVDGDDRVYTRYKYRGFTIVELGICDFHIIDDMSSKYSAYMNNFEAALKYIDLKNKTKSCRHSNSIE